MAPSGNNNSTLVDWVILASHYKHTYQSINQSVSAKIQDKKKIEKVIKNRIEKNMIGYFPIMYNEFV